MSQNTTRLESTMPTKIALVWLLLCLSIGGCAASSVQPEAGDTLRVLFVGNSLTYVNDLPGVVAAFGAANGTPIVTRSVAYGNHSLEDHWARGDARDALASGEWDVVVMQQGPSSLPENQENLKQWVGTFADEARAHGTASAVYQVWPSAGRSAAFPAVVSGYAEAAEAAGAALLPAGAAWQAAWAHQPDLELYGNDGFHPSATGTYLAALVVYGGLTGAPLGDLPARLTLGEEARIEVKAAEARLLQDVAANVLANTRR